MLIGELSKQTGVSIDTLRYYEKQGLIVGRNDERVQSNNYKDYSEDSLERICFIKDAKESGFTLKEIKKLLDLWYYQAPFSEEMQTMVVKKISEVDAKIVLLQQMRTRLEEVFNAVERGYC
ncbi:MAG: MerR family transcriptional regulator [Mangrovibacterium sp.]